MIGETIGHFKIIAKIGQGGMGVVYKAHDLTLGRTVALKSSLVSTVDNKDAIARVVQEAKTASVLDHPNICTIHEVLQTAGGQVFIAMPYYQGETLGQMLQNGPLPHAQAISVAIEVGSGLAKAHRHGIVHRDIKPGNILVTSDGIVKILDFGLATLASLRPDGTGTMMGTIAYMSPEQLRGEAVDQRADIWAWGLVLFEMLAGRLPFAAGSRSELIRAILHDRFEAKDIRDDAIPSSLDKVISKALEKDPADRYLRIEEPLSELWRCWPRSAGLQHPVGHSAAELTVPSDTVPQKASKRYTQNTRAYNLYLKGRYQWNRESPEALCKAVETLRQASEADPAYASPFCGLAECYLVMGARALLVPMDAWHKAKDASNRALCLDPMLADAHGCQGAVLAINDFNWAAAEREFQCGLDLDRESALTRHWYAIALLAPQCRFEEALAQITRAVECEPLSLIYNSTLAWICYLSQRWGLAAEQCMKTLEINPDHADSLWCLGASRGELGQWAEAIVTLKKLDQICCGIPLVYGSLGHGYARTGNIPEAERMLTAVREAGRKVYASPICEAWIHANLPGRHDQALDCLEKAYADRDFLIRYIHLSPALRPLHNEPRFLSLVRRMNLSEPAREWMDKTTTAVLPTVDNTGSAATVRGSR